MFPVSSQPGARKVDRMNLRPWVKRHIRRAVTAYSVRNRRAKASRLSQWLDTRRAETILMVGALDSHGHDRNAGIVERAVEGDRQVIGFNIYPQRMPYPFAVADATRMPFRDSCVDFALANAIIEHVGDEAAQRAFVQEHCRVARAWTITTPNKWFPIEAHTAVAFLHWRPKWRQERTEFTRLLSLREFRDLLPAGTEIRGHAWSPTFTATYAPLLPDAEHDRQRVDRGADDARWQRV